MCTEVIPLPVCRYVSASLPPVPQLGYSVTSLPLCVRVPSSSPVVRQVIPLPVCRYVSASLPPVPQLDRGTEGQRPADAESRKGVGGWLAKEYRVGYFNVLTDVLCCRLVHCSVLTDVLCCRLVHCSVLTDVLCCRLVHCRVLTDVLCCRLVHCSVFSDVLCSALQRLY